MDGILQSLSLQLRHNVDSFDRKETRCHDTKQYLSIIRLAAILREKCDLEWTFFFGLKTIHFISV